MLEIASRDGIRDIVATPHSNSEFSYDRNAHLASLQRVKERAPVEIDFSLGCDFHFSLENIESVLADPSRFCIGFTPYLLVEFSNFGIPPKC